MRLLPLLLLAACASLPYQQTTTLYACPDGSHQTGWSGVSRGGYWLPLCQLDEPECLCAVPGP